MAGRGRGRGRGALNAITKNVGAPPPEKEDPMNELRQMLNAIDVDAPSVNAVTQCAAKLMTSTENMDVILKLLLNICHRDWQFAKQAATISRDLVSREENGKQYRALLLRTMQSNFKEKETIRDDSLSKFLGGMSFMCQTFALLRSDSGEPFSPLITPVVQVLNMMLEESASDEEMECSVAQIRAIIPAIYLCEPKNLTKFHELIVVLRNDIINSRGPRALREKMLLAIEENASKSFTSKH